MIKLKLILNEITGRPSAGFLIPPKTPIPVHELFDSPYSTSDLPDYYKTERLTFDADGVPYTILFLRKKVTKNGLYGILNKDYSFNCSLMDMIEVEFIKNKGGATYRISPTRHYIKVLATVLHEILEKAKKSPHALLGFSADTLEPSRIKLYDRLTQKFAENAYIIDTKNDTLGLKHYTLIPKNILNE